MVLGRYVEGIRFKSRVVTAVKVVQIPVDSGKAGLFMDISAWCSTSK